jgi:hypothetical protein
MLTAILVGGFVGLCAYVFATVDRYVEEYKRDRENRE